MPMDEEEDVTTFLLKVPTTRWKRFKNTMDKNETINERLNDMIEQRCRVKNE